MKPEGRKCSFEDKVLTLSLLKRGTKSYTFLLSIFPLPSILNTLLRTVISALVFSTLKELNRQSLMETVCVVSCLAKCQSDGTCISVRSVAVLRALRNLETKSGQAMLQPFTGLNALWSVLKLEATSTLLLDSQKH